MIRLLLLLAAIISAMPFSLPSAAAPPGEGDVSASVHDATPHWPAAPRAKTDAPNILIILLDDVGFADLGPFGSEINTPNIQALAESGLRYNNFTTTAVCSPSRAALLTGLNHHSAGVGWLANMNSGFPGYRGEIHSNVITLPEVLRDHGYNTMMVGKWHLTNSDHQSVVGPYDSWPGQRGFERYWGIIDGEANQWAPSYLYRGNEVIDVPTDGSFYFPDAMTDTAIQMLKDQRAVSRSKPFFMYYSTAAAHAPHHTKALDREMYRGAYDQGYDQVREARLERQKKMGVVPENTVLAPHLPGVKSWRELTDDDRKMYARLQENYAAFIDNTDQQIGRLLDYLKAAGELDNTLIILSSDNGGSKETGIPGTTMATRYLHGIADTTEKNLEDYDKVGGPDTHPNYPIGWMQASNTPFNYAKGTTHGGGVRDPLIIHWPVGLADTGQVRSQFHHINDLMPSILDAAGIEAPESYRGLPVKPMEGVSMAYTFQSGAAVGRKKEQYYELAANRAYVAGDWKIVTYVKPGQRYDAVAWELYNLAEDFSESRNLAGEYPEKVAELDALWWQAARRYDVLPIHDAPIMERGKMAMSRLENIRYKRFSYQPGISTIHTIQAPILTGRSFSIVGELSRTGPEQGGVIAAMGGYDVGYTLYIKDNRLHYEVDIGGYRGELVSEKVLPVGPLTVKATFVPAPIGTSPAKKSSASEDFSSGDFSAHKLPQGTMTFYVNDEAVGSGHFAPVVPFNTWEGLDIGRDTRTAVSLAYEVPFAFTGTLETVNFEIH
ncbi:MAG: arylsulfatase [Thiogranum sp.]